MFDLIHQDPCFVPREINDHVKKSAISYDVKEKVSGSLPLFGSAPTDMGGHIGSFGRDKYDTLY